MNVLIVTGIFPPDIGGPATYVPQIASGLVERGHGVTVLTLADHLSQNRPSAISHQQSAASDQKSDVGNTQSAIQNPQSSTYPYSVIRIPRRLFKPWRRLRALGAILWLGRRADVLFVNGLAMEAVLANLLLRKPMVQKIVGDLAWETATLRGWVRESFEEFQKAGHGLRVRLLKSLRTWWCRRADKIIVPSRYLAACVVGWGIGEDRLLVIHNAVPESGPVHPVRPTLSTPVKVVTVGRLVPWKGVDRVLESVVQAQSVGLLVIGDGPQRPELEERARQLGLNGRVCFAGRRSHEETLSLMAGCSMLVLNSSYEGLPHVALEAMALGLPVVATDVGGTAEVVRDGENGRLVSTMNSGALREILSGLAASPAERQRLAEGAKATAGRFGIGEMVERTEALLAGLARKWSDSES